jgi:hypothetical protein
LIDPKARATQPQRREHQWNAYVCRWGRKKAPAIEDTMPADGTIVAAHCHERRYRHIPFSGSWRTNKPSSSCVVLYQQVNAPKRSSR